MAERTSKQSPARATRAAEAPETHRNGSPANTGTVVEIKGVVVDAVFPESLPAIYTALRIDRPAPR